MAATKPISIKMPEPMREEVERIACTRRRSRNFIINEAIESYLIAERREETEARAENVIPNAELDQRMTNRRRTD